jgi:glycosyltransferase involved in cell wall biosynthesis
MKIFLDVRKIGNKQTGDETYITNLVKNLMEIDKENFYYLGTDSYESELAISNILGKLPKNFKLVSLTPKSKLFWTNYSLTHFVRKKKIDLVHVQYLSPLTLPSKTKLITTIHDVSFKRVKKWISGKDRFILNYFIPKSLKKADKIISISEFTKKEILHFYKKISPNKIKVIYNGIDEKFKTRNNFDKQYFERIRNKYNITERYLFHLSSLQPRKNVPLLIKAYRDYIYRYKDEKTLLIIGGERGYNFDEQIDNLLRDLILKEKVRILGYLKEEELPAFYAMAEAYVSPSAYEGFDLPLGEVMQSGVPVIASNIPCHREVLGKAGVLVSPENTKFFSQEINRVLNDQVFRKKLIAEGLKRAKNFSWKKCAKETLDLYQECLKS